MPGPGSVPRITSDEIAAAILDRLGELALLGRGDAGAMAPSEVQEYQHAPEWIRWGDSKLTTPIPPAFIAAAASTMQTTQVLKAKSKNPRVWSLLLVADFLGWAAGDPTVSITFTSSLGVGSGSVELVDTVSVASPFNQVVVLRADVPAQEFNVSATLNLPAGSYAGGEVVRFSALAAPVVPTQR